MREAPLSPHTTILQQLDAMGPAAWVAGCVLILSLATHGAWLARDVGKRLDAAALGVMLKKLIEAGNAERALKLAKAHDGPACRLARIGIAARLQGANFTAPLEEATPQLLAEARAGLVPSLALGCVAIALGGWLLMNIVSVGARSELRTLAIVGVGAVVTLQIVNGRRWRAWQRELDAVANAVCDL
ncbi:MAG: hypothetical protein JST54_23115 [Deltaproteobacteria bacterium]|nr:hypothetical protein [Deltaproteobacteria bacterium]